MQRTRGTLVVSALLLACGLTACGSGDGSQASAGGIPAGQATTASSPTGAPTDASSPAKAAVHDSSSASTGTSTRSGGGQLVRLTKYGISYEVPAGWISIDGRQVLDAKSPVFQQLARRLGISASQLVTTIGKSLVAYSVSDQGAVGGFLDNVNAGGYAVASPSPAQMRLQLAGIGAKPGRAVLATTPVGRIIRIPYDWTTSGHVVHGVALTVDLGGSFAQVTVSSHDTADATKLADLVQSTLKPLS